jgi:ribosomal protein S18 acetylase RimI-like enzyme
VQIQRLDRAHAAQTVALLGALRVSLFGVCSRRLHVALVGDALRNTIDCRIAVEGTDVQGVVLAAPRSYWRSALLKHWVLASQCIAARLARRESAGVHRVPLDPIDMSTAGVPARSWKAPGDAWRIIFVGTAESARGQGVAAQLYRSLMADRSLVAHVALDNAPSIRLHRSLAWRLYRDGDVALAVHLRDDARPALG